ncbi:hypothetical protein [Shimia biformata]|uniref:hypothetical protein n=1 Tax=Shimia biformata TaxID=1294299 RepID=UPI00194E5BC5|nr:hypothetical protein [Shimia biformata]
MSDLHRRLLDAHARDDRAALVTLYSEAANQAISEDAAGFFLTQAYVFALETGHPDRAALHDRLKAMGRED